MADFRDGTEPARFDPNKRYVNQAERAGRLHYLTQTGKNCEVDGKHPCIDIARYAVTGYYLTDGQRTTTDPITVRACRRHRKLLLERPTSFDVVEKIILPTARTDTKADALDRIRRRREAQEAERADMQRALSKARAGQRDEALTILGAYPNYREYASALTDARLLRYLADRIARLDDRKDS